MTRKRTLTIISFLLNSPASPASPASAQDIVLTEFGGDVRKGTYHGPRTTIDWKGRSGELTRWCRYESADDALNGAFCADRWPMQSLNDLSRRARGNIYYGGARSFSSEPASPNSFKILSSISSCNFGLNTFHLV